MSAILLLLQFIGLCFLIIGFPAACYRLVRTAIQREWEKFFVVIFALAIWGGTFVLMKLFVPDGELSEHQYSGDAGLVQILFAVANIALTLISINTPTGKRRPKNEDDV